MWARRATVVVGSGVAADCVARALLAVHPASITVMSRTDSRATRLVESMQPAVAPSTLIRAAPWSSVGRMLAQSDVVIFATRATDPLVGAAHANALQRQRTRDSLWLDFGVPPNVAPVVRAALALAPGGPQLRRRSLADRLPHIERQASVATCETVHRLQHQLEATGERAPHHSSSAVDAAVHSVAKRTTWMLMRELGLSDLSVRDPEPTAAAFATTLAKQQITRESWCLSPRNCEILRRATVTNRTP